MQTIIKITLGHEGHNDASIEKFVVDSLDVISFLEGFLEGCMSSPNMEPFKVEILFNQDQKKA